MRIILSCLVLVLFTGCASYKPKPISAVDAASSFEARTMDSLPLKEFLGKNLNREIKPWPPEKWDFEMLTIAALYYSPDMDVARAKWGVAEAGVKTAEARPNPSIGLTPQYNADSAGGVSPWTLGLKLDIPIETANKRGYRISEAKHSSEAARLSIAGVAWEVRSRLRARLLNLYLAEKTESVLRKKLSLQEEIVKVLEERLKAGEIAQPDVTSARILLEDTRRGLLRAQGDKVESKSLLADALGLPASSIDRIDIIFPFNELPINLPPPELQKQALLNRSDILSALEEYKAREVALQLEVAKQYPDIHLGPGYSWDQGENKWSMGISVTLPLFNRNEGPIAEAEARRIEGEANFMALQAGVIGELNRAVAGYYAALEKIKTVGSLLSAGNRRIREAESLFGSGEEDRLFLLGAELEAEVLELLRLEAFADSERFLGLLEDAMHRPIKGTAFSLDYIPLSLAKRQ